MLQDLTFLLLKLIVNKLDNCVKKSVMIVLSEAYEELREHFCPPSERVDCRDVEGTVCYLDPESETLLRERLSPVRGAFLRWIDSGDFHYLSYFACRRIGRPYALVLLDHHPDMQPPVFPGVLSCGGWVRALLDGDPYLHKVMIVGIAPGLMEETKGYGERVQAWPEGSFPQSFATGLPVFLSIDKDVLNRDYARTDWDQGTMTLEEMEAVVKAVFARNKVLGTDICGELCRSKGGRDEDLEINAFTNNCLLNLITAAFCDNL